MGNIDEIECRPRGNYLLFISLLSPAAVCMFTRGRAGGGDAEVIRPAWTARCTDGVKLGVEKLTEGRSFTPIFTPNVAGVGHVTPETENFVKLLFYKISEYKLLVGAYL